MSQPELPVLLDDLANNLERISANLPPDNGDRDASKFYLHRQESGILEMKALPVKDASIKSVRVTATDVSEPVESKGKNLVKPSESDTNGPKASKPSFWKRLRLFSRYLLQLLLSISQYPLSPLHLEAVRFDRTELRSDKSGRICRLMEGK